MQIKKIGIGILYLSVAVQSYFLYDLHHKVNMILESTKQSNIKQEEIPLPDVIKIKEAVIDLAVMNKVIDITTEEELASLLKNPQHPSVVFFHMNGCGWCKKAEPIIEAIAQKPEFASVHFYAANSRQVPVTKLAQDLLDQKINGFPTFFFLNQKGLVDKQIGFMKQEDFENKIKKNFFFR